MLEFIWTDSGKGLGRCHRCGVEMHIDNWNEHRCSTPNEGADILYMQSAKQAAESASCLKKQLGCVLVSESKSIVPGFNGPPSPLLDKCQECTKTVAGPIGNHLCRAVHAERRALLNAARVGVSTEGATLYSYMGVPCKDCMLELVAAGIREIVCIKETYYDDLSKVVLMEWVEKGGKFRTLNLSPCGHFENTRYSHDGPEGPLDCPNRRGPDYACPGHCEDCEKEPSGNPEVLTHFKPDPCGRVKHDHKLSNKPDEVTCSRCRIRADEFDAMPGDSTPYSVSESPPPGWVDIEADAIDCTSARVESSAKNLKCPYCFKEYPIIPADGRDQRCLNCGRLYPEKVSK